MNSVFKLYLFYQDNNIDNWDNIILKIIINDLFNVDNKGSSSNSNSEMMTRVPFTLGKLIFIYIYIILALYFVKKLDVSTTLTLFQLEFFYSYIQCLYEIMLIALTGDLCTTPLTKLRNNI